MRALSFEPLGQTALGNYPGPSFGGSALRRGHRSSHAVVTIDRSGDKRVENISINRHIRSSHSIFEVTGERPPLRLAPSVAPRGPSSRCPGGLNRGQPFIGPCGTPKGARGIGLFAYPVATFGGHWDRPPMRSSPKGLPIVAERAAVGCHAVGSLAPCGIPEVHSKQAARSLAGSSWLPRCPYCLLLACTSGCGRSD